jgi:CxxC-x17-CxxC domain-containing protein
MNFVNRELTCAEGGSMFVVSGDEQRFFRANGFPNDPKRCKLRKAKITNVLQKIETHIKCPECGIITTVPFKLRGTKPVLCRAAQWTICRS